ncbi:MAG TPA: hypothetical protein DHW11_04525 [Gemmatimonadetes bacterium]|nr:hypothetical protein [Gemmatimonadota bacterium]
MEARGISAGEGELIGDVRGEVGKEDGVLIIRKVHVTYRVRAREEHRETVDRVHAMHADRCPVYRTLKDAIDITTEYVLEADP